MMISMKRILPAILVAGLAIGALNTGLAQVKKGKTRPLTTEQLMEAIVKPHMGELKKGLVDSKPSSDEDWKKLALSAALLNESSYTMMEDGRCPDSIWADACTKDLREGSAAAAAAIEKKDIEGALAGFKKLGASCKACHSEHKPKH
ncbi:MAG: hypothetical protein O2964_01015 [Verrucomicrobia bacterium]|jgi:cytochrome c556|nr:hypothetical protein [Verrucomicrobiota bacterium]